MGTTRLQPWGSRGGEILGGHHGWSREGLGAGESGAECRCEGVCGVRCSQWGQAPGGRKLDRPGGEMRDSGPIHGHPRAPSLCLARWADSPEHSVTFIVSFSDIFTS